MSALPSTQAGVRALIRSRPSRLDALKPAPPTPPRRRNRIRFDADRARDGLLEAAFKTLDAASTSDERRRTFDWWAGLFNDDLASVGAGEVQDLTESLQAVAREAVFDASKPTTDNQHGLPVPDELLVKAVRRTLDNGELSMATQAATIRAIVAGRDIPPGALDDLPEQALVESVPCSAAGVRSMIRGGRVSVHPERTAALTEQSSTPRATGDSMPNTRMGLRSLLRSRR